MITLYIINQNWILAALPGLLIAFLCIALVLGVWYAPKGIRWESGEKKAGRQGEEIATNMIRNAMQKEDVLLTNVPILFDGKRTKLDNVVVNKYGIFIFEVKNYVGALMGGEDDFEWDKFHTTPAGNTYAKKVKNPIRRVKRQVHILAKYLHYYGEDIWVRGYAILIQWNAPVDSEWIVKREEDIYRLIHTAKKRILRPSDVERIVKLLSPVKEGEEA